MNSLFKQCNVFQKILLFLLSCIYILIVISDIQYKYSTDLIKLSSIVLCFILTLSFGGNNVGNKDFLLLLIARLLTIFSDYFLLLTNDWVYGLAIFCIIQAVYLERHSYRFKRLLRIFTISIIGISIFLIVVDFFCNEPKLIYVLAVLYALSIVLGTIVALFAYEKDEYTSTNYNLIKYGMILFLLCDINVGIFNCFIGKDILLFNLISVARMSNYLIWLFYLPSQILLALSATKGRKSIFY